MLKQINVALSVLLLVSTVPAMAATVLTDANLDQFEAMIPKLQQLEQSSQQVVVAITRLQQDVLSQ